MNTDGLPDLSTLAVKLKSHHDSLFKKTDEAPDLATGTY